MALGNSSSGGHTWNIISAGGGNGEGAGNIGITDLTGRSTIWLEGNTNVSGALQAGSNLITDATVRTSAARLPVSSLEEAVAAKASRRTGPAVQTGSASTFTQTSPQECRSLTTVLSVLDNATQIFRLEFGDTNAAYAVDVAQGARHGEQR